MEPCLALARFAHFLALMFVFGAGVFLGAFAPAALRQALSPPLRRAAIAASLVALASALLWFALEGASMTDEWSGAYDPSVLSDVLTSTAFGLVWIARVPLLVALVALLWLTRAQNWRLATLASGFALAALALVDHGAMQSGTIGGVHRANDAVHLLMAGGWLGGLTPFAMSLAAAREEVLRPHAITAMARFSAVGMLSVALLILTGAANIALTSGRPPWPSTGVYDALLTTKLALVASMIAMASFNRAVLAPRAGRSRAARTALGLFALAELALAVAVVALVSCFGLLDPG